MKTMKVVIAPVFIGPSTLCGTFKFLWETRVSKVTMFYLLLLSLVF